MAVFISQHRLCHDGHAVAGCVDSAVSTPNRVCAFNPSCSRKTNPSSQCFSIRDIATPTICTGLGLVIQGCKSAGFDAVEIDNFDILSRFKQITQDAAFALAAQYVVIAHEVGLAIAQKNATEFTNDAHTQVGFGFALAEGCADWEECGAYGLHVLQIEYADELNTKTFEQVCQQPNHVPLTILRDRDLSPAGNSAHRYARC